MGLILSTTSPGIVVPVLKERGLTISSYGQVVLLCRMPLPGNALVVGVRRHGDLIVPHGDTVLHTGDVLTLIGSVEAIQAAQSWIGSPARTPAPSQTSVSEGSRASFLGCNLF